jgi:hypothetical protein
MLGGRASAAARGVLNAAFHLMLRSVAARAATRLEA